MEVSEAPSEIHVLDGDILVKCPKCDGKGVKELTRVTSSSVKDPLLVTFLCPGCYHKYTVAMILRVEYR